MKSIKKNPICRGTAVVLSALMALSTAAPLARAANHREAPITALDHKADITDWFAFVSYDRPDKVTMILNVDPLLAPANNGSTFNIIVTLSGRS